MNATTLKTGDRVRHKYNAGITGVVKEVSGSRYTGGEALVKLDNGRTEWLDVRDLEVVA